MRATRRITLPADDGRSPLTVTVRELTIAEVRADVLSGEDSDDLLAALFGDGWSLADLAKLCDADPAGLEAYTPRELQPLIDACKELNPYFFRVRATLLERAARILLPAIQAPQPTQPTRPTQPTLPAPTAPAESSPTTSTAPAAA